MPCSQEDTPSDLPKSQHSIHGKPDTNIGVHSRMKPTSPVATHLHNTSIHERPIRTASTAAGRDTSRSERGHKPCCPFWGTRRDISPCLRTEPFYSTTRSSNLIDLKKLHDRFLRDPLVDLRWWELGLGWTSLATAHVTRIPDPAPALQPFSNGKGKTCITDNNST